MTLNVPLADRAELVDELTSKTVLESAVVYQGRVWDVVSERVDLGDAGEVTRDFVDHPGAVAILVLREDRGQPEILLLQQYRHPVRANEWELPAGLLDVEGEEPVVGAARELAEEADLRAQRWDLLAEEVSSPGGVSEALRIFLARDLTDIPADERFERTDEEADLVLRWVALDDAVEAVMAGKLRNATTMIGVLSAARAMETGWQSLRDPREPWLSHPRRRLTDSTTTKNKG
ncbi:NUDIX hydrolase [Ornithinimicrobium sp. INDO-MA30-4]|uniref:NUDIX domain-containing protein n=1 Tax=Ornithinimicrobium sp. INDO-MA30-4 TaxID=2908651 RepID=UPI001F2DB890|nr:NUDIX hydrolase [Ornithinimicrobium sp. INDO-MA30-4]UJH70986.1 NUDIX hydrolase [Ornithinimicrobium sp. INDO-MA30-4]